MATQSISKKSVKGLDTILLLPKDNFPNKSVFAKHINANEIDPSVRLFKPYDAFSDVEGFVKSYNLKLSRAADEYVHDVVQTLGVSADYFFASQKLRDYYGLSKQSRTTRINVLLHDVDGSWESRQALKAARERHMVKKETDYYPTENSAFSDFSVKFRKGWEGDSDRNIFRVRNVVVRDSAKAAFRAVGENLGLTDGYDVMEIVFHNKPSFEANYDIVRF